MNELCPMPGCRVEAITPDGPDLLHVDARGTRPGGGCPDCGCASRAVYSRYRRHPADLPSMGCQVHAGLWVRRFYRHNAKCARRTFAERLPALVAPHARRTARLAQAQGQAGAALGGGTGQRHWAAALGGAAAARLLHRLAMPVSPDTVLRLIRGLPLPVPEPPRVVGVDDWALRKGRTYGTIVVDLERRRVVGLLPDRASTTVADWLRQRPIRRCGAGQPMRPVALSPLRSVCEAAGGGADLDAWLAEAHACGIGAVETFAAGLEKDGAAVRAALTEPWSSGQAEGQINRLKLLKRQSYGRASFDLLRQRVLMAA